ncbi:hypothetical protein HK105_204544 [Polyrhizophydium stewartii]|uniref:peptidylprolyl isomerase n=1 Tax=Polyrhizophydium stewartii TaxID=2732419 RepID=A0ABR4N8J2_9FUNG
MPVDRPWTAEQAASDAVAKKELAEFLQAHGSYAFLKDHKLHGKLASVVKGTKKPDLLKAYEALYESGGWRAEGVTLEEEASAATAASEPAKAAAATTPAAAAASAAPETPLYTKQILKKGNGQTFARKGTTAACFYAGMLEDGTVFDSNVSAKKKPTPLRFKVGAGRVIRGWDEALQTMSVGEKARLTIQSDWAYGRKGMPDAGIPPDAVLVFELELVAVD